MPATAEFLVRPAEIVGAADQVHPGLQSSQAVSGMPTFAGERRQPFTHGAIEALNKGGIEHRPSLARLQQAARLRQGY